MNGMLIGVVGGALGGAFAAIIAIFQTRLFDRERVVADYNAVRVIRNLLKHNDLPYRSFAVLRHYIGGYTEDELRKLLVRAGAIRAVSNDNREVWALWERIVKYHNTKTSLPTRLRGNVAAPEDGELFPALLERPSGKA